MVLILLIRGIYDTCILHWNDLRLHNIYIPSFMKIGTGVQAILRFRLRNLRGRDIGITDGRDRFRNFSNITVITATIWEAVMLVLLIEGIYEVSRDMSSCVITFIPSFMKIYPRNLRGCNVDIIDGGIYEVCCWDGLRCHNTHTKFNKDLFWYLKIDTANTHTDTQTTMWWHKPIFIFS
jgi:hypothetical protein